jgi:hypothetical protein
MSSTLGFADFNNDEATTDVYESKKVKHKKTYKKRAKEDNKNKITGEKVESFLNLMENMGNDDSGDGSGLADFKPPPKPLLTKQPEDKKDTQIDEDISPDDFDKLNDYAANQQYYNQYIPYYSESQNNTNVSGNKDVLFEKLNYVIQMLEENKDQKTHNVTEELVLYMFLGVFVIFVVDSFARSGKYTR